MARIPADERARRARRFAAAYKKGQSVRQIAEENQVSYGQAHKLLGEAGAKMRRRGGVARKK